MRPVVQSRPLIAVLGALTAVSAAPAASSAATTTRFEAESLASTAKVTRVATTTAADASGGKYRWMNSNGVIEVPVTTRVDAVTVRVKGTACFSPTSAFQIRTFPGYFQQDALVDPDPSRDGPTVTSWGAGTAWVTRTFHLPYGGYQAPGPLTGGAPNRVQVAFVNDGTAGCDRNLAVDYLEVTAN